MKCCIHKENKRYAAYIGALSIPLKRVKNTAIKQMIFTTFSNVNFYPFSHKIDIFPLASHTKHTHTHA